MKKRLALILAAVLVLSLVACGGGSEPDELEQSDATLTFTRENGETEILTIDEIKEIYENNEVNYNNNYKGHEVVVEGIVDSIEQEEKEIFKNIKAETALFELGEIPSIKFWIVMGSKEYEDLDFSTIEKGTKVRATGTLGKTFIDVEIDDAHDFEIISEP